MVEFFLAKERNGNTFKIIKRHYFDLRLTCASPSP